jgi:hypothetical protein
MCSARGSAITIRALLGDRAALVLDGHRSLLDPSPVSFSSLSGRPSGRLAPAQIRGPRRRSAAGNSRPTPWGSSGMGAADAVLWRYRPAGPIARPGGFVAPERRGGESAFAAPYGALENAFPSTDAPVRVRTQAAGHKGEGMTETNGDPREGRPIQNFELPDQGLLPFDLYQALKEEPLVLVFYRGDW